MAWPDLWGADRWGDCTHAREAMFVHCNTSDAPWTVNKPDCKKRARLNALRCMLRRLRYPQRDLDIVGFRPPADRRPAVAGGQQRWRRSAGGIDG
jgi:hypothetical protein